MTPCVECERKPSKGGRPWCAPCRGRVMRRAREVLRNLDPPQVGAVAARSRLHWVQEYGEDAAVLMMQDLQECIDHPERRPLELVPDPAA